MESNKPDVYKTYPTESKLYYGIQYWVSVPVGKSCFNVTIGFGLHAINESVECEDVSPDDYHELFRRAHEYAQKIIQHAGADLAQKLGLTE